MKSIGIDKVIHFIVIYAATLIIAFAYIGLSTWFDAEIPKYVCGGFAAFIAFFAGFAKEVTDKAQGKKFDFGDLLADFLGALVAFLCLLLL